MGVDSTPSQLNCRSYLFSIPLCEEKYLNPYGSQGNGEVFRKIGQLVMEDV